MITEEHGEDHEEEHEEGKIQNLYDSVKVPGKIEEENESRKTSLVANNKNDLS